MGKNRLGAIAHSPVQEPRAAAACAADTESPDRLHDRANALDSAQEAIVICGRDDRIISVNLAFTRITGYTAEDARGQTLDMLHSEREPAISHFDIYSAVREHGYWKGNLWSRRKSGENYVQTRSVRALRNEAGQTTHFIIIFSDIWRTWHAAARSPDSRIAGGLRISTHRQRA